MFCPNCGSEIDKKSKFCPNCGWKNKVTYPNEKSNLEKAIDDKIGKVKKGIAENVPKATESITNSVGKISNASGKAIATVGSKISNFFLYLKSRTDLLFGVLSIIGYRITHYITFIAIDEYYSSDYIMDYAKYLGNEKFGISISNFIKLALQDLLRDSENVEDLEKLVVFLPTISPYIILFVLIIIIIFNNKFTDILRIIISILSLGLATLFFCVSNSSYSDAKITVLWFVIFAISSIMLLTSGIIGLVIRRKNKKIVK